MPKQTNANSIAPPITSHLLRRCSRSYLCHKASNLRLNMRATTLMAAASRPISLIFAARSSLLPVRLSKASG